MNSGAAIRPVPRTPGPGVFTSARNESELTYCPGKERYVLGMQVFDGSAVYAQKLTRTGAFSGSAAKLSVTGNKAKAVDFTTCNASGRILAAWEDARTGLASPPDIWGALLSVP
jgi:hypothetical protein